MVFCATSRRQHWNVYNSSKTNLGASLRIFNSLTAQHVCPLRVESFCCIDCLWQSTVLEAERGIRVGRVCFRHIPNGDDRWISPLRYVCPRYSSAWRSGSSMLSLGLRISFTTIVVIIAYATLACSV